MLSCFVLFIEHSTLITVFTRLTCLFSINTVINNNMAKLTILHSWGNAFMPFKWEQNLPMKLWTAHICTRPHLHLCYPNLYTFPFMIFNNSSLYKKNGTFTCDLFFIWESTTFLLRMAFIYSVLHIEMCSYFSKTCRSGKCFLFIRDKHMSSMT